MRENDLRALHGYRMRRWSVGKPSVLIPNLLQRQFTVTRRNKAWVTDITYIRTWQGWLYLAVVMDLFSRKIVGWSTTNDSPRDCPRRSADGRSQQAASGYGDSFRPGHAVRQRRMATILPFQSPGAEHEPKKGNCWDNAVAESFFSSLKKERIKKQIYRNRDLATNDVADYIVRNRTRRHSYLGGMSPEQFETAHKQR